jgi:DNA-binding transcriptional ArsR family regulator
MTETDTIDELFHALADPTRRQIIQILSTEGEQSATTIYDHFNVSHPAISQHLNLLRTAGIVSVEKKAQSRFYSINQEAILEIENWTSTVRKTWESRFKVLERVLEEQRNVMNKKRS